MPVSVHIPTRIRVDPGALFLRRGCLESALTAAATRALKNSRDVVLAQRGSYVGILFHPPEFSWSGDGLVHVHSSLRSLIDQSVSQTFVQTAIDIGVFEQKRDRDVSDHLAAAEASQLVQKNRLVSSLPIYRLASYEDGGEQVPV